MADNKNICKEEVREEPKVKRQFFLMKLVKNVEICLFLRREASQYFVPTVSSKYPPAARLVVL